MSNSSLPPLQLPKSLDLPPHLSAHKYFLVCTLTVAAWDTLVLSPRTWRLFKSQGWPALKLLFHFLRIFMPVEFVVVAVAFFDTKFSASSCSHFFLFEPICTAILLAAISAVHVIRIHAIYDKNRSVLYSMSTLYAVQIVVTAICCGFYRAADLEDGQGCIATPKANWVGIYWLAPTLLYTVSFALALKRSIDSLQNKPLSPWKLMLRDGLNLYGAIWLVNMVNMLFWFIMRPDPSLQQDPIKTIVTSMAAVLSTSMTLRIILSVRGSLSGGGSFALSAASSGTGAGSASRTTHVLSARSGAPTEMAPNTFTLDEMRSKPEVEWAGADADGKSSVNDGTENKPPAVFVGDVEREENPTDMGALKVRIERAVDYDSPYRK